MIRLKAQARVTRLELGNVAPHDLLKGETKRVARYPGLRFDPDKAINRDTAAESEAINKVM